MTARRRPNAGEQGRLVPGDAPDRPRARVARQVGPFAASLRTRGDLAPGDDVLLATLRTLAEAIDREHTRLDPSGHTVATLAGRIADTVEALRRTVPVSADAVETFLASLTTPRDPA